MAKIKLQGEIDQKSSQYYEFDPEDKNSILGKGGMGIVFKGKKIHSETGKSEYVAIKVLFKDLSEESILRARRESSIKILHENIVQMHGFIETIDFDGKPKYHVISEFLDGMPLNELVRIGGVLSPWEVLKITKNVLAALYMLHGKGYVHRDIDPSNIMVCDDGKIKIIDFGIAKQIKEYHDDFQKGTLDGKFIGKVNYASPEQVQGQHWLTDSRSDIYSAGVLLFELLTGKLPFAGTTYDIIKGHLERPIPEREIQSEDLQYIVRKATQKKQDERYQSASEFIVDIEKIEQGKSPIPVNRKKLITITLTFFVIFLFGAGVYVYQNDRVEKYDTTVVQASDRMSIAMYNNALDLYQTAYKIKRTDSIASIIEMLHFLTPAISKYYNSEYVIADSLFKIAALKNSADAYYYLGEMCYEGIGTPRDFTKGFEYTSKAAELGNKLAEYRLGLIYKLGINVEPDDHKATLYFERAGRLIDKGIDANSPELIFVKGNMFMHGYGVPKNEQRALEYYQQAAELNYPKAQYVLHDFFMKTDKTSAIEWLIKSANQGYPKAEFKLGALLLSEQRYKEGLEWTIRSSNKNYSPAFQKLGAIYQVSEKSLIKDLQQSLGIIGNDSISHTYTQAALNYDSDNYLAMFELALDYAQGKGIQRNRVMAEKYFKMAKASVETLPYTEQSGVRVYDEMHSDAELIRSFNYTQFLKNN